jgi:hypothetical protein
LRRPRCAARMTLSSSSPCVASAQAARARPLEGSGQAHALPPPAR